MKTTKKQISQRQVAIKIKIDRALLNRIFHGRTTFSKEMAAELGKKYGMDRAVLAFGPTSKIRTEFKKVFGPINFPKAA